jgi:hypothetical protein
VYDVPPLRSCCSFVLHFHPVAPFPDLTRAVNQRGKRESAKEREK